MEPQNEQHLNELAEKVLKKAPLESPSLDFTANLMAQIEALPVKKSSSIQYKPLISKAGWVFIIALLSGISIYMTLDGNDDGLLFNSFDYSKVSENLFSNLLTNINLSNKVVYAIGLFGLVWCIQIPIMKQLLNRRLQH